MNCWKILQIEKTADKKKIKRAYAKLVKQYHPEENPEMFQKIRDAYQRAIDYADVVEDIESTDYPIDVDEDFGDIVQNRMYDWEDEEDNPVKDEDSFEGDDAKLEEAFGDIFPIQGDSKEDELNETFVDTSLLWKQQMAIAKTLMKGKNKESIYEWTAFLSSAEFQKVKFDVHFMEHFYRLCFWSNGSRELFDEILRFYNLAEGENELIASVEGRIEPGVQIINNKHKWILKLKNFLMKYDRDNRWVQVKLDIQTEWKKMTKEWKIEDWFFFIIFLFIILEGLGYCFLRLFGVTDLDIRRLIEFFW